MNTRLTVISAVLPLLYLALPGPCPAAPNAQLSNKQIFLMHEQEDISFDVSRQGDQIVFPAAGEGLRDLYRMNLRTRRVSRITHTSDLEDDPAFSPDGRRVVFYSLSNLSKPGHIYVCSLDGAGRKQLTHGSGVDDSSPSFSRDGRQIVFVRAHRHRPYSFGGSVWDNKDIYTMNADGSALRRLTHRLYRFEVSAPRFLPSGDIVFAAPPDVLRMAIVLLPHLHPESSRHLVKAHRGPYEPDVSPDGTRLVFVSDQVVKFEFELWLSSADGTHPVQLTHLRRYILNPRFVPGTRHVVFLMMPPHEDNRYDLMQIDTDGKGLRQIADSSLFDHPLQWKPHGEPHTAVH